MLPNKLQHGDTLASLLQKYNEMVDYLRETRLVAGPGMRINRHPAGITIESTATATGGSPTAPAQGHPFDVEIINKGTEANPDYYARVYDSGLPDSPWAGWVYVGQYDFIMKPTERKITTSGNHFIWLVVRYDNTLNPPFHLSLGIYPDGSRPPEDGSDTAWCRTIAAVQPPSSVTAFYSSNIEVTGRWC